MWHLNNRNSSYNGPLRPERNSLANAARNNPQNVRSSRYSANNDDFLAENQGFQSPARGVAFVPRAYNSASRYSVLGNLNRRNRSVSQHSHHESADEPESSQPAIASNEVDHSIDLGSDFSKFLFEE